ncbi:hypothetical protein Tco_0468033 [Tanacetum coccineum]
MVPTTEKTLELFSEVYIKSIEKCYCLETLNTLEEAIKHIPEVIEYLEYYAPTDDDLFPAEDQPLLADALPTALSPGYIAEFEPIEDDFEEDPKEDPVDYPSEEEEPLALADSASPVSDFVPSSKETEPFEEGETVAIPLSPSPSLLSPLSSPLPLIPSLPLPLPLPSLDRRNMIPEADMQP